MPQPSSLSSLRLVQPALTLFVRHPDRKLGLRVLARTAGQSPFHWQRTFSAIVGESPKRFALRLQLTRGAVLLLTSDDSVLDIAISCGFESHAGFTRAFQRRFGMSPQSYRTRGFAHQVNWSDAATHATTSAAMAPCVRLFHLSGKPSAQRRAMTYSMTRKELPAQPVLVVRSRIKRSEVAQTITSVLPAIFEYAQKNGLPLAGHPFTRYVKVGHGLMTVEVGMRIADGGASTAAATEGADGAMGAYVDLLPAGLTATTIHQGPYEGLPKAYEELESWIETEGLVATGAPWESYITDPAEYPDPNDWQTEVCWPVR